MRGGAAPAARWRACGSTRPPPADTRGVRRGHRRGRRPRWSTARTRRPGRRSTASSATWCTGAASIGFLADGCSRNAGATGSRRHASGFDAATAAELRPQLGRCRARSRPPTPRATTRSAVSNAEYMSGALMKPAARSGAGMISSAGRIASSGTTSSAWTVSTGTVPRMRPRRSRYFASPPTTTATSRSPLAMAPHARVNGVSCSTPSSAITDRDASAPMRSATMRPGSR